MFAKHILRNMAISRVIYGEIMPPGLSACTDSFYKTSNISGITGRGYFKSGLHKLWYPVVRDMSTWSKFGAHGEHGDVYLFSNLGAL